MLLTLVLVKFGLTLGEDTGLSELLLPFTQTEQFNKSLEIQQSRGLVSKYIAGFVDNTDGQTFLHLMKSIIKSQPSKRWLHKEQKCTQCYAFSASLVSLQVGSRARYSTILKESFSRWEMHALQLPIYWYNNFVDLWLWIPPTSSFLSILAFSHPAPQPFATHHIHSCQCIQIPIYHPQKITSSVNRWQSWDSGRSRKWHWLRIFRLRPDQYTTRTMYYPERWSSEQPSGKGQASCREQF